MEGAAVRAAEYNRRYSETLDKQKRLASEAARKAAGDKQVTPADPQH